MLRTIRRIIAIASFTGITVLFLDFTGTLHAWFGWLAKIQFLPAWLALNTGVVLSLLFLTLLFGRIYCSVVCPLGVFQDGISQIAGKRKKNRFRYSPALKVVRYGFLAAFASIVMAGLHAFIGWLDPYSAYGRMVAYLFAPLWQWGNNGLAYFAERIGSYAFYEVDVWLKSVPALLLAVVTLVVVAVLSWRNGRSYCNTVCPVGTVLGFLSRYAFFKPAIDTSQCNRCGLCARNCKASCIDPNAHRIDYSRCVTCLDCIATCKQGAISYTRRKAQTPKAGNPADGTRRRFFALSALFASAALKAQEKKVDGGLAAIQDKKIPTRTTPLTPPGSSNARHFNAHCTACQLCISACTNQVLRPSGNLTAFMQPEMSYERGYCRPECTRCSEVCPTGAIRPIDAAEKSALQIGHAVWIKKNCIVNSDGVNCGNCARHCPTGAIQMVASDPEMSDSPKIPVINTERCTGCGACENLCPARPFSAIYVEGHPMHRTI